LEDDVLRFVCGAACLANISFDSECFESGADASKVGGVAFAVCEVFEEDGLLVFRN
jgi:hypothetical protein